MRGPPASLRPKGYLDLFITSDSDARTGVGEVNDQICQAAERFFVGRSYGDELDGVTIVLMCRDPVYEFRRRVRLSKADKIFYMDVMLDWDQMCYAGAARKRLLLEATRKQVRELFERRRFRSFDAAQFLLDFDAMCALLTRSG